MSRLARYESLWLGLGLLVREDQGSARRNAVPVPRVEAVSFAHWHTVNMLAWAIRQGGSDVVVEARFLAGPRADLFIPDLQVVIEVLHTETMESFHRHKLAEYRGIPVRIGYLTTAEAREMTVEEALNTAFCRAKRVSDYGTV
jgi:hypothetical protein